MRIILTRVLNSTLSFTFDGSVITQDTEIVVFETLYRDETKIAVHADIDDKDQTVAIHPQPEPENHRQETIQISVFTSVWVLLLSAV